MKKEIVEEEKEEIKTNEKERTNNKILYAFVTCFILLLFAVCFIFWLLVSNKDTKNDNTYKEKEQIELKYTETTAVKSEGVYITDVSEVVDKAMPSIVAITSKTVINSGRFGPSSYGYGGSYTQEGAGSGVIVSEDENNIYILTNYHVVENSTELSVKFIDDKSYDAIVKGVSERKDIAIVSVNKSDIDTDTLETIKIATLGDSDELKVGNGIIAIGNALGYGQSVTTGVVSALNREVETEDYSQEMIQIDAAINGGNSGGALLNGKGEVVGINSAKYSSNGSSSSASIEGMGFAIPISDVKPLIETLIKGENDNSGIKLGIEGYMTSQGQMSNYRLPDGFYITAINENSYADKSELEIGNIITEIDGNKVTSVDTIKKVLNKKNKGDKVSLTIKYASRSQYKEKEIIITLD